jgi:hypothetical protein
VFSSIVQDGQDVVKPHFAAPADRSFFEASPTSFQVAGGLSGRPAFLKASLL